jgi:hypothetical protein
MQPAIESDFVHNQIIEAQKLKKILDDAKLKDENLPKEPEAKIRGIIELTERTIEMHQINKMIMEEQGVKELYGISLKETDNIINECFAYKLFLENYLEQEHFQTPKFDDLPEYKLKAIEGNTEPIESKTFGSRPIRQVQVYYVDGEYKYKVIGEFTPGPKGEEDIERIKDEEFNIDKYETDINKDVKKKIGGPRRPNEKELEIIKKELNSKHVLCYLIRVFPNLSVNSYADPDLKSMNIPQNLSIVRNIYHLLEDFGVKVIVFTFSDSCTAICYNKHNSTFQYPSTNLLSVTRELLRDYYSRADFGSPLSVDIYGSNFKLFASICDNNYNSLLIHP